MSAETLREFVAARERVAALEATPPPHTVAALLARVEEARRKAGTLADEEEGRAVMDRSIISYDRGRARGLQDAARFVREWASAEPAADGATIAEARRDERRLCIADMRGEIDGAAERAYMERVGARINRRATLTPSPLDGVVAEVCALPVEMPTFYASVDVCVLHDDGICEAYDLDHLLRRGENRCHFRNFGMVIANRLANDLGQTPAGRHHLADISMIQKVLLTLDFDKTFFRFTGFFQDKREALSVDFVDHELSDVVEKATRKRFLGLSDFPTLRDSLATHSDGECVHPKIFHRERVVPKFREHRKYRERKDKLRDGVKT
jgi:hypothetical protein